MGQYEKAVEDSDQAIKLDPSLADPHVDRGRAYYKLGKRDLHWLILIEP